MCIIPAFTSLNPPLSLNIPEYMIMRIFLICKLSLYGQFVRVCGVHWRLNKLPQQHCVCLILVSDWLSN